LGNGVEVRGTIALGREAHLSREQGGLRIDRYHLVDLRAQAWKNYKEASFLINRNSQAHACFAWDGEVVNRTRGGYPEFNDINLGDWLRSAANDLCDVHNQAASIPRRSDGRPSLNPEHWGIWPACNRSLWAWRQLLRMAEVIRLCDTKNDFVCPRYETLPSLRSMGPNLAVYRCLGVPIFRPRPGHIFLTGRISDLRARCLAAVCVARGYVAKGRARLFQYVLREPDSLTIAAAELYTAYNKRTVDQFAELQESTADEYFLWLWLTNALLETVPLGLPSSLLTVLLHLEYLLEELRELDVQKLQATLISHVACELGPFLDDGTADLVAARQGQTANEVTRRLVNFKHPETYGAGLRNSIQGQGRRRARIELAQDAGAGQATGCRVSPRTTSRRSLFEYRAWTLGGGVTRRSSQATVRQEEVLRAADEVMLGVAYALVEKGFRLLGVAGGDFVVENPAASSQDVASLVGEIASGAAERVLPGLAVPVTVDVAEEW